MRVFPVLTALALAACVAPASAQYSTGFEPPAYTAGSPVVGVDGWTQTTGSPDQVPVQTTYVHSGLQALGLQQPAAGGKVAIALLHSFAPVTASILKIDVWMMPGDSTDSTGTWFAIEEDNSASKRSALFGFRSGVIAYNNGGAWTNSATSYTLGEWYKFTSVMDYSSRTWSLLINDTPFASNLGFFHAGHVKGNSLRIYKGGNNAGMAVDDLVVVPEPTSLLALAMGVAGFAGALRRR